MTESERDQFNQTILATAEYYNRPLSPGAVKIFWAVLRGLSLDEVQRAIELHMGDQDRGSRFPMAADIILQLQQGRPDPGDQAWAAVVRAMEDEGGYSSVQFEDGTINAVIRSMGGWVQICEQDLSKPWTERDFRERYTRFRRAGESDSSHLPGRFEIDNRGRGFAVEPPVLVRTQRQLPVDARRQIASSDQDETVH